MDELAQNRAHWIGFRTNAVEPFDSTSREPVNIVYDTQAHKILHYE
jgi:hypothetical protein